VKEKGRRKGERKSSVVSPSENSLENTLGFNRRIMVYLCEKQLTRTHCRLPHTGYAYRHSGRPSIMKSFRCLSNYSLTVQLKHPKYSIVPRVALTALL